jgi:hypothetical protein
VLNLTRRRVIGIAIAVAVVFILVSPFVWPSPHEVHTPGAEALNTRTVGSDPPAYSAQAIQPSQSLNDVRCAIWRARRPQTADCLDAATLAGLYFPKLTQSPRTLYVPWLWCVSTSRGANGFNVEYQPSRRALVIHCYLATPWIWRQQLTSYPNPQPWLSLLLVPTASLPAGPVSVIEDDRIEHLIGDQSAEHQMATATIS